MSHRKSSLWLDTAPPPVHFPPVHGNLAVDVLVLGGGITGVTTAYLLKAAGLKVVLVEQGRIAGGETGHTTAHVTFVTDTRLSELASRHGKSRACAFWEAARTGLNEIVANVETENIDCALREVPGHLIAGFGKDSEKESQSLRDEAALADELGFDAHFLPADPVFGRPAVRFPNQRKFHPVRYLEALVERIPGAGCRVFDQTSGNSVDEDEHALVTDSGKITYDQIVIATHAPARGERSHLSAAVLQTKLALYSTYAIEALVPPTPESLFWDTNEPYFYYRFDDTPDGCSVILGGEDHKTGQVRETQAPFAKLEQLLHQHFPGAAVRRHWSGQVVETPDGLPYIGRINDRTLVGTGYSGTGMTLGTFAGCLLADLVMARSNPLAKTFDPHRKALVGATEYISENIDFPVHFIKDRLTPTATPEEIAPGSGAIVRVDGHRCAMSRDPAGHLSAVTAICPHMGCIVNWNQAEQTWDCPCHGSRFASDGRLIAGPAETGLEPVEIRVSPQARQGG